MNLDAFDWLASAAHGFGFALWHRGNLSRLLAIVRELREEDARAIAAARREADELRAYLGALDETLAGVADCEAARTARCIVARALGRGEELHA